MSCNELPPTTSQWMMAGCSGSDSDSSGTDNGGDLGQPALTLRTNANCSNPPGVANTLPSTWSLGGAVGDSDSSSSDVEIKEEYGVNKLPSGQALLCMGCCTIEAQCTCDHFLPAMGHGGGTDGNAPPAGNGCPPNVFTGESREQHDTELFIDGQCNEKLSESVACPCKSYRCMACSQS